jgi:radical SAM protein with 4Fe4S-binding SPASM domain
MIKALEMTLAVNNCLSCLHCPQAALGDVYKSDKRRMRLADFYTIVDKIPKDCQLHFSGFNEAMMHPDFSEMLLFASKSDLEIHLFTTLVGLNHEKAGAILNSDIASIRLHLPNGVEFKYDIQKWLKLLDMFLDTGKSFTAMSLHEIEPALENALMERGIAVENPQVLSRAGNLGWVAANKPITGPVTCQAQRWHMNECMPTGDVYLCSMDWGLKMPVGNLLTQTYEEIHAAAEKYRLNFNPAADSPCRSCDWSRPA